MNETEQPVDSSARVCNNLHKCLHIHICIALLCANGKPRGISPSKSPPPPILYTPQTVAKEFWCILRGVIAEGSEGELIEDCNITHKN